MDMHTVMVRARVTSESGGAKSAKRVLRAH